MVVVGDAAFVVPVATKTEVVTAAEVVVCVVGAFSIVVIVVGGSGIVVAAGDVVNPQLGQVVYKAKSA